MLLRVSDAALSFLTCCEAERRPVAAQMLGLATSLLEAAKRGGGRRGEVQQLSAIRNRRWRWNGRSAMPAFSPATGRPMLRSAVRQASPGAGKWRLWEPICRESD